MITNTFTLGFLLLALFAPSIAYNYDEKGDDWTDGACATGTWQSPIDFCTDDANELADMVAMDLQLNYNEFSGTDVSLTWPDDHAAKVSRISGGSMGSMTGMISYSATNQYTFELLQFHFHAGSEHTIDGERFDLCMHMVHQTSDDTLARPYAVIGVLYEEGDENAFLKDLIENTKVDMTKIWEEGIVEEWLYYEGGLTTPGCDEVVNWFIWPKVQKASKEQIAYIAGKEDIDGNTKDTYHETYRNVKPVNGRNLWYWDSLGDFDFAGVLSLAFITFFCF